MLLLPMLLLFFKATIPCSFYSLFHVAPESSRHPSRLEPLLLVVFFQCGWGQLSKEKVECPLREAQQVPSYDKTLNIIRALIDLCYEGVPVTSFHRRAFFVTFGSHDLKCPLGCSGGNL